MLQEDVHSYEVLHDVVHVQRPSFSMQATSGGEDMAGMRTLKQGLQRQKVLALDAGVAAHVVMAAQHQPHAQASQDHIQDASVIPGHVCHSRST